MSNGDAPERLRVKARDLIINFDTLWGSFFDPARRDPKDPSKFNPPTKEEIKQFLERDRGITTPAEWTIIESMVEATDLQVQSTIKAVNTFGKHKS